MEDNRYEFGFEPMDEQPAQQSHEERRYTYSPYDQPPQKPKKEGETGKLILLVAVVAILGSIGGSLLTSAVSGIREPDKTIEAPVAEEGYVLEKHALPEKLSTNDTGKTLSAAQVYELTVKRHFYPFFQ